jgi:azurin
MQLKIASLSIACALALAACGGDDSAPAENNDTPATAPTPADQPAGQPATQPADQAAQPAAPAAGQAGAPAGTDTGAAAGAAGTGDAGSAAAAGGAGGKPEAVVSNCSTTIQGDDAMQFDVGSITVPSSCSEFTINLRHVGKLPVAAMGHNVVISRASDRQPIAADGMTAGVEGDYVKDGDDRVIAHTELIGGGQETSVTFQVSKLQGEGPFEFFCSFPGHWTVMRGPIRVG